jgi:hypothetical protein
MPADATPEATAFADLKFTDRPSHPMGEQATAFFPNGYGASVIRGPASYGGDEGLYELAVLKGSAEDFNLDYTTPLTDDVLGHLSPEDVTEALRQIAALPVVAKVEA